MNSQVLRVSLYVGCAYFVAMAVAHYFSIKVPVLFVYYDTPFYPYQDKIISFAVTAYVALFWCAARNRSVVPAALIVLGITVAGLISVTLSEDLENVLYPGQSTLPYWAQTAFLAFYFAWLCGWYWQDRKGS